MKKLKDLGSLPGGQGQRTPDFEVTDPSNPQVGIRTVEVKRPTSIDNNPSTIIGNVNDALKSPPQSGNVIIDATLGGFTKEVALEALRLMSTRLNSGRFARLNSVRIVGRDYDVSTKYPDTCL